MGMAYPHYSFERFSGIISRVGWIRAWALADLTSYASPPDLNRLIKDSAIVKSRRREFTQMRDHIGKKNK